MHFSLQDGGLLVLLPSATDLIKKMQGHDLISDSHLQSIRMDPLLPIPKVFKNFTSSCDLIEHQFRWLSLLWSTIPSRVVKHCQISSLDLLEQKLPSFYRSHVIFAFIGNMSVCIRAQRKQLVLLLASKISSRAEML